MKVLRLAASLTVSVSAGCLMAAAGDIAVDNYVREDIVATNGDIVAGSIFMAPNAVAIEKTGTNALTLSVNAIQTRGEVPVRVLEGSLNILPSPRPSLEMPSCMQRAAIWLDAMRGETLVAPDGASGDEVARWYDVRETCTDGTWSANYYCAEAKASFVTNEVSPGVWETVVRYPVKKTSLTNGLDYVDFNGRSSGSWMRLLTSARTDVSAVNLVHHVFYSGCISGSWGWPLGANKSNTSFWFPSSFDGSLANLAGNSTNPGVYAGTTRWNGQDVDPYSTALVPGPYLHEWHSGHVVGTFGNFFNEREIWSAANGYRCGGDALGEVVVFTNRLSAAERMAVGEYLLRKWTREARTSAFGVSAATNTLISVEPGVSAVYAGAGNIQAAAGAEVVYSAKGPAAGTFRIGAGEAKVFAGELPFAFLPGDQVTVGQDAYAVFSASNESDAALAADGVASLSLSATSSVRVAAMPEGMRRLSARGQGEVVLSAPRDDYAPKSGGEIFATMPNSDMEEWQSADTAVSQSALGTYYNWTITSRPAGWLYFVNMANCRAGDGFWIIDGGTKANFSYEDYPFQGDVVMVLKQGLVIENTVTFPRAGDYELTFLSAGRMHSVRGSNAYAGGQVKMSLVRGGVTNEIGTAMGYTEYATRRQRFRVRGVEAGTYTFVLNHDVGNGDVHTMLDDFRFRLITDPETEMVVRPPNGDFERADIPVASRTDFSVDNTVSDWTFATSGQTMADVNVLTRGMVSNARYLDSASAWGGVQLALYGGSAAITSESFTLPAGTWRLRCRMGGMFVNGAPKWNGKSTSRKRNLQASLVADGVETPLGTTGDHYSPDMDTVLFDEPVALAEAKTVRLRVWQTVADSSSAVACAVIDDLELVRAEGGEGSVMHETFETTSGWTFQAIRDGASQTSSSSVDVKDPCRTVQNEYPYAYGRTYGVNNKALEFRQCCTAVKQVVFPVAGTYRLSFSSRGRVWLYPTPSMDYAGNQVAFFLVGMNNATNEFYRSPSIYSTNFVFRSALFDVPAAGTYTFGIRSLNGWPMEDGSHLQVAKSPTDATVFIDQVLVDKANETREPDIPETLVLEVSDGARLRLDFAGTNRIDTLRVNGKSLHGYIDASHPSGLVSGLGCLEVGMKGTIIVFR